MNLDINSIAVIGASRFKEKLGYWVLKNIIRGGFRGEIYPVNPKAKKILEKDCFPSVKDIRKPVDLAVIIVPAPIVERILKECVEAKIKYVVIISAGFSENGEEGKSREEKLKEIIKDTKTRVIGPNCLGLIFPYLNINATFTACAPRKGHIGFISQSGALATALFDWADKNQIGFSSFVSLGNKIDFGENDALKILWKDEKTRVIGIYLESFQNGKEFVELAREISQDKPIVVLKAGKTKEGASAISSHTGAMVGLPEVTSAAFRKGGVIEAENIEEFYRLMALFSRYYNLKNDYGLTVVTNAGGPGILFTDTAIKNGLNLSSLSPETIKKLGEKLPKISSLKNPIDIGGDADAKRYEETFSILEKDNNVKTIIALLTPQAVTEVKDTAKVIIKTAKKSKKFYLACFLGGKTVEPGILLLKKNKIPTYSYPEELALILKKLFDFYKNKEKLKKLNSLKNFSFPSHSLTEIEKIIKKNLAEKKLYLDYADTFQIFNILGFKSVKTILANNLESALYFWRRIKKPICLKASSDKIIHKLEKKAVYLNLNNTEEIKKVFSQLRKLNASIYAQEMGDRGTEIIIGAKKDREFGHVIIFGWGGVYTEIIKDFCYGIVPLSLNEAEEIVKNTKVFKILNGYRNFPPCNLKNLYLLLVKLSLFIYNFPEITEMDLNPIFVSEKEETIIDARIKIT